MGARTVSTARLLACWLLLAAADASPLNSTDASRSAGPWAWLVSRPQGVARLLGDLAKRALDAAPLFLAGADRALGAGWASVKPAAAVAEHAKTAVDAALWGAAGLRPAAGSPLARALAEAGALTRAAVRALATAPALRRARRLLDACLGPGAPALAVCLRQQALRLLWRARGPSLRLLGGALELEPATGAAGAAGRAAGRAAEPGATELPTDSEQLDALIAEELGELAAGHVLKLQLTPQLMEAVRGGYEQFRGKRHKLIMIFILVVAVLKMMLLPFAIGTVALVATKALVVGLMSMTMSLAVGLGKLVSHHGDHHGDHHGESTYEVIVPPSQPVYGYGHGGRRPGYYHAYRSLPPETEPDQLQQAREQSVAPSAGPYAVYEPSGRQPDPRLSNRGR